MRFVSAETRAKISAAATGRKRSAEHTAKIVAKLRGRPGKSPSAETRARMSAAKKGRPLTPEHRAKIGASIRGIPKTKEHIEKIRLSRLAFELVKAHPGKLPDGVRERRRHLKREYGITQDDFDAMLARQGGRCKICASDNPRGKNWHVDHCHKSRRIRGLLCGPCNQMLGAAKDSVSILRSAIEYLEREC